MRELTSKYRTAEKLGQGGMGKVFRGEMFGIEGFERIVAIKMLRGLYHSHNAAQARFAREARICGSLQHRNVVSVLDFDRSDAGEPFLVMEYVDGADLRVLTKCANISIDASVYIAAEVLRALAYAHEQGVIHRDVKPRNVLISRTGDVKLTDFGLAKQREHNSANQPARKSPLRGTVGYIAPEMTKQESSDHRADLFMVGVMLYELVTGQLPFGKESLTETTTRMFAGPPEEPSALRPDVPELLNALILRLLRVQPEERYADADEVCRELSTCADMARGAEEVATLAHAADKATAHTSRGKDSQATEYVELLGGHSNLLHVSENRATRGRKRLRRFALLAAALALVAISTWSLYEPATPPDSAEQTLAIDEPGMEPQKLTATPTVAEAPGKAEPDGVRLPKTMTESSRSTANRPRARAPNKPRMAHPLTENVANQDDSRLTSGTFVAPDRQHHL